ncbi:hypothetical protein Tsubulata_008498 [Turnera subulata]|uniref:DNA replication ATP-dependent helicase/nuclease n=1 Tax=Turnera subulata TaxID=218843 RepID=A0A9Q0G655_9ROSI|nr:hypothetical protein Tsubulata_008498 [Turnera subulata]
MGPRKKSKTSAASAVTTPASSSSSSSSSSAAAKRNNQPSQPSKYGIQHFFHRHAQLSQSANPSNPIHPNPPNPTIHPNPSPAPDASPPSFSPGMQISPKSRLPAMQNPLLGSKRTNPFQDTAIPETISLPPTLSPFTTPPSLSYSNPNDRLPDAAKCNGTSDKLGLWNHKKALLELLDQVQDAISDEESVPNDINPSKVQRQSGSQMPVKPDSLANEAFKDTSETVSRPGPNDIDPSKLQCQSGSQMTVKADSLAKEAFKETTETVSRPLSNHNSLSVPNDINPSKVQFQNGSQMAVKADSLAKEAFKDTTETVSRPLSNHNFLVLEVSEKHEPSDSASTRCPFKVLVLNSLANFSRISNFVKGNKVTNNLQVLRLLNEQSGVERAVYLWEEWFYTVIAPGDTVNVIGEFDEHGKCDVNRENNLLIVHPDILVSGTRHGFVYFSVVLPNKSTRSQVAASFSCPRRAVLDERLKSSEHSTAALIGTLLHQIFQAGLVMEHSTIQFLEEYARIVLQQNIDSLYACGVHENDMLKVLVEAIPKICDWIARFRVPQDSNATTVDFGSGDELKKLKIAEVIDIEEMAWAPKYGLKGMIDASLRVKSSMEHIAQVILYTLLMSDRYLKHIDCGLLYYLQSDQTQGITVRRSDVVGLIMRRNELANDILKASTIQQLPPMLQSPSMCRGCRHLDVCTIYHKVHGGGTESSGLGNMFDARVQHLTMAHRVFLRHWDLLIDLEAKETQLAKNEIWRSSGFKGDNSSGSLSSIVLDTSDGRPHQKSLKDNRFIYRFVHKKIPSHGVCESDGDSLSVLSSPRNDLDNIFKRGDYVILSTESSHQTIASGIIADSSRFHVSVSFPKRLRLPGSSCHAEVQDLFQQVWRIDKDEFLTSFSIMRFNLVQLFLQIEQSSHLRKMIVDLEAPRFDSGCIFSQDPALSYIWSVKSLNADQRRAILKILTAKDYALILGMPGTGKTSTMVHAVKALLMRGASILLTSYTNSAVDNLLIKLKAQGIDFLRIGRHEAVHEDVRANCFSALDAHSTEDIRLRLEQVKVVAVTCMGITSPLLASKKFDVCIMDEAGQIALPISLGPLMFASKFVLVGDHYQLPPLVQSAEAREKGMGISLFCRLSEAHPHAISALQSQYRMSGGIMELSNALIYGDRLSCGSPEVANAELKFFSLRSCSLWQKQVLDPSRSLVFINTDMLPGLETKTSKTVNNLAEAYVVAEVTKGLIDGGIDGNQIGIITPYNSQANLIRTVVELTSVEIHTIDKYQGRDKDCILVSFVRSCENPRNFSSSLLGDWHRINVAVTRAKRKLIMVGSCRTLSKVPLLKLLIEKVEEQSGILNVTKDDINCKKQHEGELQKC